MDRSQAENTYKVLHDKICGSFRVADEEAIYDLHPWRKETGYGFAGVFRDGCLIEKGAVNYSAVEGRTSANMLKTLGVDEGERFWATGISSIIHPVNPFVPIAHMNVRYFELDGGRAWFGGGMDITPHYVDVEEASWFHRALKGICDEYDSACYREFKSQADDYFFLPHRGETRGVGGIFFDRLGVTNREEFDKVFTFTCRLAESFASVYLSLSDRNRHRPYTGKERKWQLLRRGRYVEFNLIYDRGTRFGLESNGRIESVMSSMPPGACWEYDFQHGGGSQEEATVQLLRKGIDWAGGEVSPAAPEREGGRHN